MKDRKDIDKKYTWDLEKIYSSIDVFNADYDKVKSMINNLSKYEDNMMDNSSIHIMKYQDGITTDLTHQNATGAYLAALCMYAEVYDKDPTKVTYNGGIKETTANTLKSYAKKHCYNN
mgnify:CR=1 FL=1